MSHVPQKGAICIRPSLGWGGVFRPILALLPIPALGGIICVSYFIWCILWIVLYCILGGRESVSTLPVWTTIVPGAALLGSLMAEVSFA